jgi:hypothetical protein
MSITKILSQEQKHIDRIKTLLWKQTENHPLGMPCYYGVLYYGKSFTGDQLESGLYARRWKLNEVRKTHRFVNGLIRKTFGKDIPVWWSIERHSDYVDDEGDTHKGSFHSNVYIGGISDDVIEHPSPYLMPLFYKEDECGIPINQRPVDMDNLKLLLLNACIRQAKWVGNHPNALSLSMVPPEEMEQTFMYGLKNFNTSLQQMDEIVDFGNSSYYKP